MVGVVGRSPSAVVHESLYGFAGPNTYYRISIGGMQRRLSILALGIRLEALNYFLRSSSSKDMSGILSRQGQMAQK
jgi:hypothetical protein